MKERPLARLCFDEWLTKRKVFCAKKMKYIRYIEDCSGCPVRIKEIQLKDWIDWLLSK